MFNDFFKDFHREQIIAECVKRLNAYHNGSYYYLRGSKESLDNPIFSTWEFDDECLKWQFHGAFYSRETHDVIYATVYGLVTTLNGGQYRSYAHKIDGDKLYD